jgi:hypothetical protein
LQHQFCWLCLCFSGNLRTPQSAKIFGPGSHLYVPFAFILPVAAFLMLKVRRDVWNQAQKEADERKEKDRQRIQKIANQVEQMTQNGIANRDDDTNSAASDSIGTLKKNNTSSKVWSTNYELIEQSVTLPWLDLNIGLLRNSLLLQLHFSPWAKFILKCNFVSCFQFVFCCAFSFWNQALRSIV